MPSYLFVLVFASDFDLSLSRVADLVDISVSFVSALSGTKS